jgi:hypothetical protein
MYTGEITIPLLRMGKKNYKSQRHIWKAHLKITFADLEFQNQKVGIKGM